MITDGGNLSERKKLILKAIVDAHIQHGEPVGSKILTQNKQITCSSATIRNEMAELETMGYLEQPHTSAGRVPSELGYRFYVASLIEHYAMTTAEIAQINAIVYEQTGITPDVEEKLLRFARAAIAVAAQMSLEYRQALVGKDLEVLFEEENGEYYTGHAPNYVKVYAAGDDLHNLIRQVKITALHQDGVIGILR